MSRKVSTILWNGGSNIDFNFLAYELRESPCWRLDILLHCWVHNLHSVIHHAFDFIAPSKLKPSPLPLSLSSFVVLIWSVKVRESSFIFTYISYLSYVLTSSFPALITAKMVLLCSIYFSGFLLLLGFFRWLQSLLLLSFFKLLLIRLFFTFHCFPFSFNEYFCVNFGKYWFLFISFKFREGWIWATVIPMLLLVEKREMHLSNCR